MTIQKMLTAATVLVALTGCRNALLDTPQPVVRTPLELHASAPVGDTMRVAITLGTGPTRSVGSLTGELLRAPDWRFVGCEAAQGEPVMACKEHPQSIRVAAAWAAGTHAGELLTLTFVRTAVGAVPGWQLSLQEVHGVDGRSLVDDLEVRADVVTRTGGAN